VGPGIGFDEMLLVNLDWLRSMVEVSPVIEGDAVARTSTKAAESVRVLALTFCEIDHFATIVFGILPITTRAKLERIPDAPLSIRIQ